MQKKEENETIKLKGLFQRNPSTSNSDKYLISLHSLNPKSNTKVTNTKEIIIYQRSS